MYLLTIAIPTYGRNDLVLASIKSLEPQLNDQARLLIIDNHSPVPVAPVSISRHTTIVRNQINIGGNGNILRCFELSESEWIWVLGDDDQVLSDSVSRILEAISTSPSAIYLNFSTIGSFCRKADRSGAGRSDLIKNIDNFGNLLFHLLQRL